MRQVGNDTPTRPSAIVARISISTPATRVR
jgi:hypothetical protein